MTTETTTAATITRLHCDAHWTFDERCCEAVETFTFVTEVEVNGRRFDATYGTFRDTVETACPVCDRDGCSRECDFATGERLLSGYQPRPGEIVKNVWSYCRACGWNQAS